MIFVVIKDKTMISRFIILMAGIFLLGGCNAFSGVKHVPADFIVEQNITTVLNKLNTSMTHDYFVWYQGGTEKLAKEEQLKLLSWIDAEQPVMICLRGTGGAEKYRGLAENRAFGVISYLQAQKIGIDIVKLDYDPSIRGGRVLINKITPELAEEIKSTAPILVIKSD